MSTNNRDPPEWWLHQSQHHTHATTPYVFSQGGKNGQRAVQISGEAFTVIDNLCSSDHQGTYDPLKVRLGLYSLSQRLHPYRMHFSKRCLKKEKEMRHKNEEEKIIEIGGLF